MVLWRLLSFRALQCGAQRGARASPRVARRLQRGIPWSPSGGRRLQRGILRTAECRPRRKVGALTGSAGLKGAQLRRNGSVQSVVGEIPAGGHRGRQALDWGPPHPSPRRRQSLQGEPSGQICRHSCDSVRGLLKTAGTTPGAPHPKGALLHHGRSNTGQPTEGAHSGQPPVERTWLAGMDLQVDEPSQGAQHSRHTSTQHVVREVSAEDVRNAAPGSGLGSLQCQAGSGLVQGQECDFVHGLE